MSELTSWSGAAGDGGAALVAADRAPGAAGAVGGDHRAVASRRRRPSPSVRAPPSLVSSSRLILGAWMIFRGTVTEFEGFMCKTYSFLSVFLSDNQRFEVPHAKNKTVGNHAVLSLNAPDPGSGRK